VSVENHLQIFKASSKFLNGNNEGSMSNITRLRRAAAAWLLGPVARIKYNLRILVF